MLEESKEKPGYWLISKGYLREISITLSDCARFIDNARGLDRGGTGSGQGFGCDTRAVESHVDLRRRGRGVVAIESRGGGLGQLRIVDHDRDQHPEEAEASDDLGK